MKEPGQGRSEPRLDGKVVRLPVDWLGPREELVPFGPSARGDQPEEAEGPITPLRAEDFWGESSAAIHDALEPPAPVARPPRPVASPPAPRPPVPASPRRHHPRLPRMRPRITLSLGWLRARASLRWTEVASRMIRTPLGRLHAPGRPHPRGLAATAAVAAAALFTFLQLGPVARVTHRTSQPVGSLMTESFHPPTAAAVARVGESVAVRWPRARPMPHPLRSARHAAAPQRSRVIEVNTTTPSTTSAPPTAGYTSGAARVQVTSPVTSATSTGTLSAAEPQVSQGSTSSGSASTGSRAAAAQSSSPSGPVGPGAPFGPGHLG
jgi:hypothetical protein